MDFIQIYSRKDNAWGERYEMSPKYGENWVLDKSTDSAQDIEFQIQDVTEPTFDVNDWVRILHVSTADEAASYDSEGLPLNHTQYCIGSYARTYVGALEKWKISLALIEPTERTQGIIGESLNYTNQTSKVYNDITYTKQPFNHYTALRRWLMLTPANCDKYDNNYTPEHGQYRRIVAGDKVYTEAFDTFTTWANYLPSPPSNEEAETILTFTDGSKIFVLNDMGENALVFDDGAWHSLGYMNSGVMDWSETGGNYNFGDRVISQINHSGVRQLFLSEYLNENISWYNRIKILDKTWLETLPFADDTYNELSLYNVLMDNFDSSVGRTPCFYFDINPLTDLPYNKTRDEYKLKFLRQDGFDKPVLQWDSLMAAEPNVCTAAFDLTTKKEAANYAKGLVANVSNLSAGRTISFPSEGLYAVPEILDDSKRDTTKDEYKKSGDDWGLRLPHKVSKITKLTRMQLRGSKVYSGPINWLLGRESNQVTVLEKKEYLASETTPEQNNAIAWFEEGSNEIHLRSYFYYDDDQATAVFYVEYEPLIDCRIEIGDMDFAQQVNQSSSQVDATKFSEFMANYKNSMNKADVFFGKCYYSLHFYAFSDLIGSRVQKDNKMYMITNIGYQKHGLQYYVYFQLNENHFRKNNSYQAPQNIREDIAISIDSVKDRRAFIKQTIKLGLTPQTAEGYQFLTDKKTAISGLVPNAVSASLYPQVAFVQTSSVLTKSGGTELFIKDLLAPIARLVFANTIMFNVRFLNNAIAGKKKTPDYREVSVPQGGVELKNIYPFGDIKEQLPILYTDPFGEVQKLSCYFGVLTVDGFDELTYSNSSENEPKFFETKNAYYSLANLPQLDLEQWVAIKTTSAISVENQNLYKSQLETLNQTVGIEYKGDGVIPCKKLLENSRLMKRSNNYFAIYALFFAEAMSETDDSTSGYIAGTSDTGSLSSDYVRFHIPQLSIPNTYNSIVITRSGYPSEKLLIINNPPSEWKEQLKTTGEFKIYFA